MKTETTEILKNAAQYSRVELIVMLSSEALDFKVNSIKEKNALTVKLVKTLEVK